MGEVKDFELCSGGALETVKQLQRNRVSVDLIFTSPPTWGMRDSGYKDQVGVERTPELYFGRVLEVFDHIKDLLSDQGTMWVHLGDVYSGSGKGRWANKEAPKETNVPSTGDRNLQCQSGVPPKNRLMLPYRLAIHLQERGWYLRQVNHWVKPNAKPENVPDRPTTSSDPIFMLSKKDRGYQWNLDKAQDGTDKRVSRRMRNTWTINTNSDRVEGTPRWMTVQPIELARRIMTISGRPRGTVLDPFCGTSTTGVSALKHGMSYIGIDIAEEAIEVSQKRLNRIQSNEVINLGEYEGENAAQRIINFEGEER